MEVTIRYEQRLPPGILEGGGWKRKIIREKKYEHESLRKEKKQRIIKSAKAIRGEHQMKRNNKSFKGMKKYLSKGNK